jgi:hypothetical protein
LATVSGTTPTAVKFVYPQRKVLSAVQEWEWLRTDFISSWEGDVELVEDIANLWSYTGASDNADDPSPWTNEGSYYILSSSPNDLRSAIDLLNTGIGNRSYTESNYIDNGDTVTESLNELDIALQDVEDMLEAGLGEKYVESISFGFAKNTVHALPTALVAAGGYTPDSTAGREGKNMDVFVDGQLVAADTGSNGANADRDYGETTTSGITFRFDIQQGRNITYIVRQ